MKRLLMVSGAVMLSAVVVTGCGSRRDYTYVPPQRLDALKAQACVERYEPNGKTPQVMTYDSSTNTEVHLNQDGKVVTVTGQNKPDSTSFGVGAKVGGARPDNCTDDTVVLREKRTSRRDRRDRSR